MAGRVGIALISLVALSRAVTFDLQVHTIKCLQEDVQKDVLVVGDYDMGMSPQQPVQIEITDSRNHRVYMKDDATKGKFAFTSDDYDVFSICFTSKANPDQVHEGSRAVSLNLKTGVEATSYDEIGKAEKLKPMELELRRLEDLSESVVNHFARMKQREEEHRDTNESTNEKMLHYSIFSMFWLLTLAIWQVVYLKRYFKQKKLI